RRHAAVLLDRRRLRLDQPRRTRRDRSPLQLPAAGERGREAPRRCVRGVDDRGPLGPHLQRRDGASEPRAELGRAPRGLAVSISGGGRRATSVLPLNVNGSERRVEAPDEESLLSVLRNRLGLTGTHYGCGEGQCGSCTVLVDGRAVRSCQTPAAQASGKK